MSQSITSRIISAIAVGLVIFLVAILLPKIIVGGDVAPIATTQALELTLSLLAIAIFGRAHFGDYGFRRPQSGYLKAANMGHIAISVVVAVVLGMAATMTVLSIGAVGNPLVRKLSPLQIVLFVWIFSSTIEEIFTRGFIQSHVAQATTASINFGLFRIQIPVLISALSFAAMHLILLRSGADAATLFIILPFAFFVGLLAGHERSRSDSLIPAIGIHMLANIGGMLGGIIYAIISVISGHGIPTP